MSAAEAEVIPPEAAAKKTRSRAMVKHEEAPVAVTEPSADTQMLQTLMTEAIRSGNKELMREVMEIRRELKAEAARDAFFAALSAFQAECPVIKKTKQGGGGKYWYAPLSVIVQMAGKHITAHGLSYKIITRVEPPSEQTKVATIYATCQVFHEMGHSESSEFSVPVDPTFVNVLKMNEPQAFASASTYAKRYAFCNAFGILTGEDDDDGQSAGRLTPNEARAQRQPVSQPRQTPTAQRAEAQKVNGGAQQKTDLEAAGEGEAIDANTVKGLAAAMEHAKLGQEQFKERFPKLAGLEQVKKADTRAIMSWIADPIRN